jgi:hypothetical protein
MTRLDWTVVAPLAVTLALALGGYLATYFNGLRLDQRKDRLDRVNRQLSELYGPLLALASASSHSWEVFRGHFQTKTWRFFEPESPPTKEAMQTWRQWMRHVFMPLNERMMELVITKPDLLDSPTMPDCLLELAAHVAAYRAFIAQWDNSDFSQNKALIEFPPGVLNYTAGTFSKLKEEQQQLLGHREPSEVRRPLTGASRGRPGQPTTSPQRLTSR